MQGGGDFDFVLVGGGLASSLVALALHAARPAARVLLIERGPTLGGNHTWSFHESDLAGDARTLVEPLVETSWSAHDVVFPLLQRRLSSKYQSFGAPSLDSAVRASFAARASSELALGQSVARVDGTSVTFDDGRVARGRVVVDGRGVSSNDDSLGAVFRGGYQKFVGLELELTEDAPRTLPLLMDARVEQLDGYRFVYVLPFTSRRVLVEDTYYSRSPRLDRAEIAARVLAYAESHGYRVGRVLREEHGVLPIPTHVTRSAEPNGPVRAGMRAGWFHPTTGYSLPMAARFAIMAATCVPEELPERARAFSLRHEKNARFARFLNRLLFGAFAPESRRHVLERFYTLPDDVIARFYALESTRWDHAHILCGRPPRGFSVSQLLLGDATV